jgi:hypothetical protein
MDYGAPVGWRLALKHPERVTGLIVQNGNAYQEGLKGFWDPIKAYWADGSDAHRQALKGLLTLEATKFQYTDGVADVSRISPDNWVHDQALLDRPGNNDIQLDLFYDYRTNLRLYPAVQAYFRQHQPPTLILWGKNDQIFPADGAHPYKRDLHDLEFHLLDTGHFALEDKADEMVPLIRDFSTGRLNVNKCRWSKSAHFLAASGLPLQAKLDALITDFETNLAPPRLRSTRITHSGPSRRMSSRSSMRCARSGPRKGGLHRVSRIVGSTDTSGVAEAILHDRLGGRA